MKDQNISSMTSSIAKKGFKRKVPLVMAILGPIIVMLILGYIVTLAGTADTVNIGIVNQDKGLGNISASSSIIEELQNQDNTKLISINEDQINENIKNRTIDAVIIFPANFTQDMALKNHTDLTLKVEGTDQMKTAMVNKALLNSTMSVAAKSGNAVNPLTITNDSFYGKEMDFTDLFIYRIMALVTLLLSGAIALITILEDKKNERFRKIASSPFKAVTAYMAGLSIFSIITALTVLSYVIFIMKVEIVGDLISIILLMVLIGLVGLSLGILAGAIAKTERQAFGLFAVIAILQVLFGGLIIPVLRFDYYVQLISAVLPLTYALDAMKSLIIRGFSLSDVGIDIIVLFIMMISILAISAITMKIRSSPKKEVI